MLAPGYCRANTAEIKGQHQPLGANTTPAPQRSLGSITAATTSHPAPRWPRAPATCQLQRDNDLPPRACPQCIPIPSPALPHPGARAACSCPPCPQGSAPALLELMAPWVPVPQLPSPLPCPRTTLALSLALPPPAKSTLTLSSPPSGAHVHGLAVPTPVPDPLLSPRTLPAMVPACPRTLQNSAGRGSQVPPCQEQG